MLYVDIFPEPSIKGALSMLNTYRDDIDDFIMLPDSLRIVPSLRWAILNFENPKILQHYELYVKNGKRAKGELKALSMYWKSRGVPMLADYNIKFEVVDRKICASSPETLKGISQDIFDDPDFFISIG